jgi:hypothetical protein
MGLEVAYPFLYLAQARLLEDQLVRRDHLNNMTGFGVSLLAPLAVLPRLALPVFAVRW